MHIGLRSSNYCITCIVNYSFTRTGEGWCYLYIFLLLTHVWDCLICNQSAGLRLKSTILDFLIHAYLSFYSMLLLHISYISMFVSCTIKHMWAHSHILTNQPACAEVTIWPLIRYINTIFFQLLASTRYMRRDIALQRFTTLLFFSFYTV